MKTTIRLIKKRYEYWEGTRGAYVLPQKYRDELKEFIFTGKCKTLCNFETYKKHLKKEMAAARKKRKNNELD
jgi:hypothetical protein